MTIKRVRHVTCAIRNQFSSVPVAEADNADQAGALALRFKTWENPRKETRSDDLQHASHVGPRHHASPTSVGVVKRRQHTVLEQIHTR